MINFFPELKRPKSDGMRSALGLEDLRNPFEIHLGLFGEDDSSDGAADNNPVDADAGRFSGRGNTQAAAGTPSRGTTFGVDGVSKTGSTALDAQIGYTDDDNRGNPGANFNALNNATSEQTIAAVAAAREAQDRGGSPGQVESAVGSALDNYSTGTVDRSGGLTDKGRSYIDDIVNQTFAPPSSLSTSDPDEIFDTVDLSSSTPSMALPDSLPASRSAEVSRALSRTSSAILSMPNAGIGSGIPRNLIDDELKTRAEAGDRIAQAGLTPSPYELATDSRVPAVGIMTTPQATAANVLQGPPSYSQIQRVKAGPSRSGVTAALDYPGVNRDTLATGVIPRDQSQVLLSDLTADPSGTERFGANYLPDLAGTAPSDMARMAAADAGMITDASPRSNQVVLGGGTDNMGAVNDPRFGGSDFSNQVVLGGGTNNMNLVNDARFGGPATLPTAAGTVRDLQRARDTAPASIAAGPVLSGATTVDDDFAEMGQRGGLTQAQINAGIGYDERGLPRGLQTFTNNQGITATTNLAGTTQAQRDNMPGYMNPEKDGLQDTIFGNPLDTAYGYELNRQGDVTGVVGRPMGGGLMGAGAELLTNAIMGPPETVEDLLNRSVYTGFGEGSQIGMDGGGDSPTKAANDPCPAGYQMVNGACQISGDIIDVAEDGPGSGFVINPITGLPTLFQPTTQATQVGQVNPFALQPYTPMQAQNIQQARSGIQALSPTGAALGRVI